MFRHSMGSHMHAVRLYLVLWLTDLTVRQIQENHYVIVGDIPELYPGVVGEWGELYF